MNGKFFNLLLAVALLFAFMRPSFAVTQCYFGGVTSYALITCYTGDTVACQKQELTYQGVTTTSRQCASSCTENTAGTTSGGTTTKTWCCTSDKCNFSSTLTSNKVLTGFSILVATLMAFFKSN